MTKIIQTKLIGGKFKIPVTMEVDQKRISFKFAYNRPLMEEVKRMKGAKWHGYDEKNPRKVWSVANCARNWFQIKYLAGLNPYERYEEPIKQLENIERPLFPHQVEMVEYVLSRKQVILACEMGLGKTLAAIEVMERSGTEDWIWVGPRSALEAVRIDFKKWGAKFKPIFMTYDGLWRDVENKTIWIPQGVVFDESTKIKTPTAKRSQAASILVEEMRSKNADCFIILMSGAPAPRSPADYWHQCEVACPGFLAEGDYNKFKRTLSIIVEKEGPSGVYPELVTWLDDERKCAICGKLPEGHFDPLVAAHDYKPSVNEVKRLHKRMNGLVLTKFKRDCLNLPDKHFLKYTVEPSKSTLRMLSLIKTTAKRTIEALILIRELSDGFQYQQGESEDTVPCPRCKGARSVLDHGHPENPETLIDCPKCEGVGTLPKEERKVIQVPCPKDQLLIDLLDEYEAVGRFVVYAGFQASVDRVVEICLRYKWDVIRVDGRGWAYYSEGNKLKSSQDMLTAFQSGEGNRTVFVGNPAAAGMGLTLTASPAVFFFSNSFNGEDRIQAMDRIHRPGMDFNLGAKIIDVIHLPVDEYILENLDKKMHLQSLSLGQLKEHM